MFRRTTVDDSWNWTNPFSEGWGLYAEKLAHEVRQLVVNFFSQVSFNFQDNSYYPSKHGPRPIFELNSPLDWFL